jgi:hypothetical protein
MFKESCKEIRESIYGVLCQSQIGENQVNFGNGTAFMIAPGVCATAAHVLHVEGDRSKPIHQKIQIIRAPEVGGPMSIARLLAEDIDRDLALIEILDPVNSTSVKLNKKKVENGTSCGSLGFPLAVVVQVNNQISFNLVERFQSASISAFQKMKTQLGSTMDFYETDSLMYGGSSGCPGFTVEGEIFGMMVASISETPNANNSNRLAISLWVPSSDIASFAKANGVSGVGKLIKQN